MSSDRPAIRCENLGKTYRLYRKPSDRLWELIWPRGPGRGQPFIALEGVSFELRRGEVLGVVGLNGAGKSTLLQLITGTLKPTEGWVRTHGRIAAILELGSGFNPEFTGRENIYLNAATLGLSKGEIDDRLDQIISFAGIGKHIDQPVKTYSSGMMIRLGFSVATSVDPDILIIDEALSVGDGSFSRKSFDRIMEIKAGGATILFCSHVLFHIDTFCDRVLWLDQGRARGFGEVSRVLGLYQEFLDGDGIDRSLVEVSGDSGPATPRFERVSISLDGVVGTELWGQSGRSTLRVEVAFCSDPLLPCPTTAVVLSNEAGRIVGSSASVTSGGGPKRDPEGNGSASFTLASIPLNRGRYRVGVYLLCERGMHGYEMQDPAAHLNIEREGVEQGPWVLGGVWAE